MKTFSLCPVPYTPRFLEKKTRDDIAAGEGALELILSDSFPWTDERIQSWPWRYSEPVLDRFYRFLVDRGMDVLAIAPDPASTMSLLCGEHLAYLGGASDGIPAGIEDLRAVMEDDVCALWPGVSVEFRTDVHVFRTLSRLPDPPDSLAGLFDDVDSLLRELTHTNESLESWIYAADIDHPGVESRKREWTRGLESLNGLLELIRTRAEGVYDPAALDAFLDRRRRPLIERARHIDLWLSYLRFPRPSS